MATLGKNQVFEIKNGDGTSFHNLVLRKSAVESIVMSLGDKISGDVYYKDNSLSVTMHEYITYNGVNYMLVNPPTIVREGIVSDNSELKGMTKYSFVFYHPMCQLANFPFSDVAVTSDETRYLGESKTFSWIGKPADFVAKLNKNLTGTEWIVELSSRFPQDKLDELSDVIPFDNATIADACKTFYDTWGVPYVVDKVTPTEASYAAGKRFKIVMGLPSNEIYSSAQAEQQGTPFVFQMGHGVGLKNNSRTPRNNKIITRISGYGSENNIPYGYPQVRWYGTAGQAFTYGDHAGVYTDVTIDGVHLDKVISYPIYKGVLDGEYVELIKHPFTRAHLMPSVYRTCLFNKISFLDDNGEFNTDYDPDITLIDYYDAVYSSQYPYPNTINLQAPSYESHEFEDEKPELGEAHIISATPLNNDLTPASSWDDSLDDEGNYKQSYFQMVLPQLSFDLYACASITEEMQINMRSGTCLGCTFTVQVDWDDYKRNFYDEEGNFAPNGSQRDLTKYPKSNQGSISLVLQKDNSTFGTLMPNMYQYPKGETSAGAGDGDTFVILGISLPESYIFAAEWRLDADMKSYMLENNVHYFDYPLKFDEDFLFHNENILSQIRPNTVVRFNYAGQTQALFVKQITVKYGDQPLPQYDITLTDNVEVVLNQIGHVAEDVEKLSTLIAILRQSYGKNVWNELAKKLSKTQDDTAAGYITMLKGLQIGASFVPDILGEGGVLRMRDDGKVELVTDILYARVKAYFDSVEIREYQHTGGNRIASVAGNKICRVAWFNSSNVELEQTQANLASVAYFRCYFRASDGEDTVRNNWLVGDQAYCHITSVTTSSDNPEQKGLNQKHLWRLVIGRNNDGTLTEDGEAYIDLSNRATETISGNSYTGYQSGSDIPEAQDDIIQLGNVNDTTRQGAIVEFVTGTDAPSYQIYQGINSFSLNGKNQIGFGYNTGTGRAYLNVYGDAYIGARDRSTFIEYKQDDGTQQHAPVLNIKAKIQTLPNSTYEGKTASQFVQDNQLKYDTDIQNLTNITNDLQSQIDGEIVSWFYEGTPTLDNAPAVDWDTDTLKERHLGDMYYDVGTGVTSGFAYRFIKSEQGVYDWQYIDDTAITLALAKAAEALGLAGSKAKTYTTANNVLPSAPYNVGDLWLNATGTWGSGANAVTWENEILKCINACPAGGTPDISDWAKASKYTDDSAFNGYINAFLNGSGASGDSATAAAIQKAIASALGSGTVVDGGLLLTSLIGMRKYKGSGSTTDVANYDTWAGISGQYDANVLGGGIAAWYGGGMLDKETLTDQQIAQGWNTLRWAKGVDRFDGSGYRADGNISWNANGALTIKNITTLSDSNNKNILNELATFNSAFTFATSGEGSTTVLSITPQQPFTELYIGTAKNDSTKAATQGWVNQNFVTKTFFDNIFRVYNGAESDANKIAVNGTLPTDKTNLNIEAMFGFWTKKYISALGQGDDGSTSYTTLAQLNDVSLSNPTANQVLSYNGTHWVNKSIELGSQTLADLTDVVITSPAANQMLGYDATTQKWKNIAIPATGVTSVALSMPTGFSITGSPITASGTFTVSFASGYSLPTTAKQSNWDTAYGWGDHADAGYALAADLGTASSHAHSDYLTSLSWDSTNKKLSWSKGGAAQTAITIGYASVAGSVAWAAVTGTPTTIADYGITDAKIANGVITIGANSITPVTTLYTLSVYGGTTKVLDFKPNANASLYIKAGGDISLTNDTPNKYITLSYSLPLATSGTRGGVKIGYSETNSGTSTNRNYAVQLSSEKMFVNVPWENTWRGIQNNLTSTSTTDSLSAAQGKALKGYIDTLNGYFSNGVAKSAAKLTTVSKTAWGQTYWNSDGVPTSISGSLSSVTNITMSGYIKIGDAYLSYDRTNNAIRVSANADGTGAMNFYARGGVSALGETADGQAGVGDVTWALLADGTDTRQIALSHLTTSLTTITGGTTDATNKKYAVYKNSSNQLFVDVPWQSGAGTVTSVKVGSTSYTPSAAGVISLPAYPTSLPASDVYTWAKQSTKPTYSYSEITGTPTIPAAANNGTFSIKTLVGTTTTTISDFTANQSTADDFTLVQGDNVTFTLDTTNRKLTIKAKDTTYESKAAASGGTAVSLVTTGEKYTWNSKAAGNHTHTTSIATSTAANQLTLAFGSKYAITAGGTSYVFTMPSNPNTNTTYKFTIGSTTKGDATNGVDLGTLKSETAASGGTTLSLVTTGEKYSWNNKTYTTTIAAAASTETNQITLAFGTKYKLTAGGTSYIFTMPANPDTDIKVKVNNTNPTTGTWYYPVWYTATNGTGEVNANDGFRYYSLQGTASALGESYLQIGNSTASGTAGNKRGHLRIYGNKAYYGEFNMIDNLSENKTYTFDTAGTILTSGNSSVTKSGQTLTVTINGTALSLTNSTYTLAGLMGSTAIGSSTEPIYWTGTAFAKTTYKLEKSVPSTAVFTDHYDWSDITSKPLTLTKNTTGFSISGGTTSKTLTVSESYTLGAACAKGVTDNSSNADVTSTDTNLITGRTLYYQLAKKGYTTNTGTVTSVATGTGLTGGTITGSGTISINSTYQTYISHGETAYNNYYSKYGGSLYGEMYLGDSTTAFGANPSTSARIGAFTDHGGGGVFQFGSNGGSFEFIDPSWSKAFVRISTSALTGSNVSAGYTQILHPLGSDGSTWPLSVGTTTYGLIFGIDDNGDRTIGKYGSTSSSIRIGGHLKVDSGIEIYNLSDVTPYIDFHYNNSSYDYTTRLVEPNLGILRLEAFERSAAFVVGRGSNGDYLQIGSIRLVYDSTNNAIKVIHSDGSNANLYATGGVSALGAGQESGGGGDVTWALLASQATGGRYIHQSYISGALSNYLPLSGGSISGATYFNSTLWAGGVNTAVSSVSTIPVRFIVSGNWACIAGVSTHGLLFGVDEDGDPTIGTYGESSYFNYLRLGGKIKIDSGLEIFNFKDNMPYIDFHYNNDTSDYTTRIIEHQRGYLKMEANVLAYSYGNISDMRQKDVVENCAISLNAIANSPSFKFTWKNKKWGTDLQIGTSAQYWKAILPEVVTEAKDDMHTLSMQYGVAALISAITVARKVMTHEEKIALLETRVSALEKENGEQEMLINSLQEELSKFKAA